MELRINTEGFNSKGIEALAYLEKRYFEGATISIPLLQETYNKVGKEYGKEIVKAWDWFKFVYGRYVHFRDSLLDPMDINDLIEKCEKGDSGALWVQTEDYQSYYARLKKPEQYDGRAMISQGWLPFLSIVKGQLFLKYSQIIGGFKIANIKGELLSPEPKKSYI